jgi:hypothetical protein
MLGNFKYYQLVVLLIAAVMVYFGLEKFLRREAGQTLLKLVTRIVVWGGMAAVALVPDITNYLAHFIGLEGNINAVILIAFILVFLLIFKTLSAVERIESQISILTRQEALAGLPKKPDEKLNRP